ncbi:MAG: DEAD/DEAH box helicase [Magnetococcales bacterium]|nr:DEAD/DEAH box helicase [Magnetococcales bacterium]
MAFPDSLHGITLRSYQQNATEAAMGATQGIIISPTGSGKTVTALELIRRRGQRTLIMLDSNALAKQWVDVIRKRLAIVAGRIGDGNWTVGNHITVATAQTLNLRKSETAKLVASIGTIVIDECHIIPAETFAAVVGMFPARYRYGFTATPNRSDGLNDMINRLIGPTLAEVDEQDVLATGGIVSARIIAMDTGCRFPHVRVEDRRHGDFLAAIETDPGRNSMIVRLGSLHSKTRQTLILTDRTEHAETLSAMMPSAVLAHGKLPVAKKRLAFAQMESAPVVIGTKGLLGKGLDYSSWSCLIIASPISGETPLQQGIGRVVRGYPGKKDALVIDLVDPHPYGFSSWKKRRAVYSRRGWPVSMNR